MSKKHIYFAGISCMKRTKILLDSGFKYYMCSFASPPSKNVLNLINSYPDTKIMLDSGAFSAWNKGYFIDINKYISFLKNNKIDYYFNLDVIGDVEGTKRNQQILEDAGLNPIPVYHFGEDYDYLHYLVSEGYDLIGLGGTVGKSVKLRKSFFEDVFYLYPNQKFHGLGVTAKNLVEDFNWYSVDSTTWLRPFKGNEIIDEYGKSHKTTEDNPLVRFNESLQYFKNLSNLERID